MASSVTALSMMLLCTSAAQAQQDRAGSSDQQEPRVASDRRGLDVEAGYGFAAGSGAENPAPSLGTITFGATVWLGERWGTGIMLVRSFGEDRFHESVEAGQPIVHLATDLRYTRIVARYRRPLAGQRLVIGFGFVRHGSFAHGIRDANTGRPPGPGTSWSGSTGEATWQHRLHRRLSLRAGVTFDTNVETTVVQPLALAVVTF
jgi:hypothetical protein